MRSKSAFLFLFLFIFSSSGFAVRNLGEVVPNQLYRSAAFSDTNDIRQTVATYRLRTIVNLENGWNNDFPPEREKLWCSNNDINYSNPALSGLSRPSAADIRKIVALVVSAEKPVLIHCLHGQDRTGLVIGAYRILIENWSYEDAYREMVSYGHSPTGILGDWKYVLKEIAQSRL